MKIIVEDGTEYIDPEIHSLDGDDLMIEFADGYGATDISIGGFYITWDQFDILKHALREAEERWR